MKITDLDKLLNNVKFLTDVKRAALNHKDDHIPEKDESIYAAMMWSRGMIETLRARGFKIEKDEK